MIMNKQSEDQIDREEAEKLLADPRGPEDRARAHLTLGCLHENEADWEAAIVSYREMLANDPQDPILQYYGNNNLGFSLIQLGRFDEAEDYCAAAIAVDEGRHNAHKNLGLVCQGQGRWADAAMCFVAAYRRNPRDPRAWRHLQQLLEARPNLLLQDEGLRREVGALRRMIEAGGCALAH
jgi:tetratricopeptide (TPR) repeat protein